MALVPIDRRRGIPVSSHDIGQRIPRPVDCRRRTARSHAQRPDTNRHHRPVARSRWPIARTAGDMTSRAIRDGVMLGEFAGRNVSTAPSQCSHL